MAYYQRRGSVPPKRHTQLRDEGGRLLYEELMGAVGDECVYLESGSATVETVFGTLQARPGDYVLLPRATTHRWLPGTDGVRAYCIEANSHITPVRRYLSKYGQLLEHAPYCERDLHGPSAPLLADGTDVEVFVKHRGPGGTIRGTRFVYPQHPFDVVGW